MRIISYFKEKMVWTTGSTLGWEQKPFLLLHSYGLLVLYLALNSPLTSEPSDKALKEAVILRELGIAINAYRCLTGYSHAGKLNGDDDEDLETQVRKKLSIWVTEYLDSLFANNTSGVEVCFPCGTKDHAVYLTLYWRDENTLSLRIDNLTSDRKASDYHRHESNSGKSKTKTGLPYFVGLFDKGIEDDKAELKRYLVNLAYHRLYSKWKENAANVITAIYASIPIAEPESDKTPQLVIDNANDWPRLECQRVDNCVYKSYEAGIRYRTYALYVHEKAKSQPLMDWLWQSQVQWAINQRQQSQQPENSFRQYLERRNAQLQSFNSISSSSSSTASSNFQAGNLSHQENWRGIVIRSNSSEEVTKLVAGLNEVSEELRTKLTTPSALQAQVEAIGQKAQIKGKAEFKYENTVLTIELMVDKQASDFHVSFEKTLQQLFSAQVQQFELISQRYFQQTPLASASDITTKILDELEKQVRDGLVKKYLPWKTVKGLFDETSLELKPEYISLELLSDIKLKRKVKETEGQEKAGATNKDIRNERLSSYEDLFGDRRNLALENLFKTDSECFKKEELEEANNKKHNLQPMTIVVLGRAGIGKTTLAKYISQVWAEGKRTVQAPNPRNTHNNSNNDDDDNASHSSAETTRATRLFPEFDWVFTLLLRDLGQPKFQTRKQITLREWIFQSYIAILDINEKNFEALWKGRIEPALKAGKGLLILDGYDELPEAHNCQDVLTALNEDSLSTIPKLITSRPHAGNSLRRGRRIEVVGFRNESIQSYIENRFKDDKSYATELLRLLRTNVYLWSNAHIPITLNIMCWVLSDKSVTKGDNGEIVLPRAFATMTGLYEMMLLKLLARGYTRDYEKQKHSTSPLKPLARVDLEKTRNKQLHNHYALLLQRLSAIAYAGVASSETTVLSSACVEQALEECHVEPEDLELTLAQLQGLGLLQPVLVEANGKPIRSSQQGYEFLHFTFQEFYAARHIASKLKSVNHDQRMKMEKVVLKQKYNPRFEIIWWFVAGLLKDKSGALNLFFATLDKKPKDLVGLYPDALILRCMDECKSVLNKIMQKIVDRRVTFRGSITFIQWLSVRRMNQRFLLSQNIFVFPEVKRKYAIETDEMMQDIRKLFKNIENTPGNPLNPNNEKFSFVNTYKSSAVTEHINLYKEIMSEPRMVKAIVRFLSELKSKNEEQEKLTVSKENKLEELIIPRLRARISQVLTIEEMQNIFGDENSKKVWSDLKIQCDKCFANLNASSLDEIAKLLVDLEYEKDLDDMSYEFALLIKQRVIIDSLCKLPIKNILKLQPGNSHYSTFAKMLVLRAICDGIPIYIKGERTITIGHQPLKNVSNEQLQALREIIDDVSSKINFSILINESELKEKLMDFTKAYPKLLRTEIEGLLRRLLGIRKDAVFAPNSNKTESRFNRSIDYFFENSSLCFSRVLDSKINDNDSEWPQTTISSKDNEGETWVQEPYLLFSSYKLLALYLVLNSNLNSEQTNNTYNASKKEDVLEKLGIAVNAYRCLAGYKHAGKPDNNDENSIRKKLTVWVEQYLTSLFANCDKGFKVCFPCGAQDQAMYLQMQWREENILSLRIDSLTSGSKVSGYSSDNATPDQSKIKTALPDFACVIHIPRMDDAEKFKSYEDIREILKSYLVNLAYHRLYSKWKDNANTVINDIKDPRLLFFAQLAKLLIQGYRFQLSRTKATTILIENTQSEKSTSRTTRRLLLLKDFFHQLLNENQLNSHVQLEVYRDFGEHTKVDLLCIRSDTSKTATQVVKLLKQASGDYIRESLSHTFFRDFNTKSASTPNKEYTIRCALQ